jgi:hypothetical protein
MGMSWLIFLTGPTASNPMSLNAPRELPGGAATPQFVESLNEHDVFFNVLYGVA